MPFASPYLLLVVVDVIPDAVFRHVRAGDVSGADGGVCRRQERVESGRHHFGFGEAAAALGQHRGERERLQVKAQLLAVPVTCVGGGGVI